MVVSVLVWCVDCCGDVGVVGNDVLIDGSCFVVWVFCVNI